jgi:transcription elongation factor
MRASEVTGTLEQLVGTLEKALREQAGGPGDAIEEVLSGAQRSTQVVSIRESQEVEAFRSELVDGLIRADTANQLLRLVNEWVLRLLQGAG